MLAMATKNVVKCNPAQALVLDMDMQGSALSGMLFGKTAPGKDGKAKQFFDQRILSYYSKSSENFISSPKFRLFNTETPGQVADEIVINVATASPDMEDRVVFRANSRLNYSSQITYTAFTAGLREVLSELNRFCETPPKYVFFDMPPNSNGYSDAVLELLLQEDSGVRVKKDSACNYFALTTLDRSHMNATLSWFKSFVNEKYNFPDRFFFVFNNVPSEIASMNVDDPLVAEAIPYMESQVQEILRSEKREYQGRIYFLGIHYQLEYLRACCSSNALGINGDDMPTKTEMVPMTMLNPVAFLKPMCQNNTTTGTPTQDLIHLLMPAKKTGGVI